MTDRAKSELEARAAQAVESGQLAEALELYQKLEEIDPQEIAWPRRQAEIAQELHLPELELSALLRAGDLYNADGYFARAVETFKLVLAIDPFNTVAEERLSGLQTPQATSVDYTEAAADPEAPTSSAPLDELVLTEVVSGARPASLSELAQGGIAEIPLDDANNLDDAGDDLLVLTEVIDEPDDDPRKMLAQAPLFASLGARALRQLVAGARVLELPAGAQLFRQGDLPDALYLVVDGAVVPIAEGPVRKKLAVLEMGDFFGEIALFTDQPRSATIQALVDSQLVSIGRPAIRKLVAQHPDVLAALLRFARQRLIDRLVRTSPLFGALDTNERGELARQFQFLEVAAGRMLVSQDAPAEALFLLLAGQMDAIHFDHDGEKVLGTLGPGDLIGEISLLTREPSLTSMVARGKCWVLSLPAQNFHRMLECYPHVEEVLGHLAEERAAQNQKTVRDGVLHCEGRIDLF